MRAITKRDVIIKDLYRDNTSNASNGKFDFLMEEKEYPYSFAYTHLYVSIKVCMHIQTLMQIYAQTRELIKYAYTQTYINIRTYREITT